MQTLEEYPVSLVYTFRSGDGVENNIVSIYIKEVPTHQPCIEHNPVLYCDWDYSACESSFQSHSIFFLSYG